MINCRLRRPGRSKLFNQSGARFAGRIQITQVIALVACCWLLAASIGCEAFVRKFTRKAKKERIPKPELVLVPEQYLPPQVSPEELYRKYFTFWKSWHDELIQALIPNANHKKQVDCAEEAVKNLMSLRGLLTEARQKKLDGHISNLNDLKDMIARDPYGTQASRHRSRAETLRRNILRDFSYPKVKTDVKI